MRAFDYRRVLEYILLFGVLMKTSALMKTSVLMKISALKRLYCIFRNYFSNENIDLLRTIWQYASRTCQAVCPTLPNPVLPFYNNSFGDRQVMDVTSFMSSIGVATGGPAKQDSHGPWNRRPASAPGSRTTSPQRNLSPEELMQRKQSFKEFLGRNFQTVERKERHVREVEDQNKFKFTPKLCRKSLKMQHFKGTFMDRLDREISKRADREQKISVSTAPGCTFQPSINSKSEKLKPRSWKEMSRGDLLRKETSHRMIRLRTEQVQTDWCTDLTIRSGNFQLLYFAMLH